MSTVRVFAAIGLMGVLAAATGCKDDEARTWIASRDKYLLDNYNWELKAAKAICQLEKHSSGPLNDAERICPGVAPDLIPPPTYPPKGE